VMQGLAVRFTLLFDDFVAPKKVQIDEKAFFPSDAALASWRAQAEAGLADIVYENA
jgi:DNA polymerase III subunit alpha